MSRLKNQKHIVNISAGVHSTESPKHGISKDFWVLVCQMSRSLSRIASSTALRPSSGTSEGGFGNGQMDDIINGVDSGFSGLLYRPFELLGPSRKVTQMHLLQKQAREIQVG